MSTGIETLRLMDKDNLVATITVDWRNEKVLDVQYFTDVNVLLPFNPSKQPTWEDFEYFLRSRCFDESNGQKKKILRSLDLDFFEPIDIIRATNGRNFDDHQWLKFEGGAKSYADIVFQKGNSYI